MGTFVPLVLAVALSQSPAPAAREPIAKRQWLSLDVYHLSRAFPALARTIETPINPGLQLGYHRTLFGRVFRGGLSVQSALHSFDQLFWSLSAGSGFEGTFRSRSGFFAGLALRVDYARLFTGSNHFVLEDGSYRQQTDSGRGFLRVSPVDLSLGFAPEPLRRLGIVPALRYAWLLEFPMYPNDGANPWSYTAFGLSMLWMWEGAR